MAVDPTAQLLVVEDDQDVRESLIDLLGEMGYTATGALNGYRALELARQHRFQLALLDYKMPGLNGVETARRLLELLPDLNCVMITGFADALTTASATEAGIHRVLAKPVGVPYLLELIDELLPRY